MLIVFSIPETERDRRHRLRSTLSGMGFGTVAPGVWAAPGTMEEVAGETIERIGLSADVDFFRTGRRTPTSCARGWASGWDLPAIQNEYDDFVARYRDAPAVLKGASACPGRRSASTYPCSPSGGGCRTRDPGLPAEVLPADWVGQRAADLFTDLDALLRSPAREHALRTIHG